MKTTDNIKQHITNLKIRKKLLCIGTTFCTYRLGQIASFKYMGFLDNAPALIINTLVIGNIFLDGYLSYRYWELENEKEELEKNLKN